MVKITPGRSRPAVSRPMPSESRCTCDHWSLTIDPSSALTTRPSEQSRISDGVTNAATNAPVR
jgi:hypothetical protein